MSVYRVNPQREEVSPPAYRWVIEWRNLIPCIAPTGPIIGNVVAGIVVGFRCGHVLVIVLCSIFIAAIVATRGIRRLSTSFHATSEQVDEVKGVLRRIGHLYEFPDAAMDALPDLTSITKLSQWPRRALVIAPKEVGLEVPKGWS